MKRKKILVCLPLFKEAKDLLESVADVEIIPFIEYEHLIKIIENYDGLLGGGKCDNEFFNRAKKLKIISITGVGYDSIDLKAATKNDVIVTNVPGVMAESVAELTIGLVLACSRKIVYSNNIIKKQSYNFEELRGIEIYNKTLGQIGFGTIGTLVANKFKKAFDMRVLVYDPYINYPRVYDLGGKYVDLKTLLKESDIITINALLTAETFHMIDKKEFSLMKKDVIIVNTARGGIIAEEALIDAIRSKKVYAAGVDVIESSFEDKENPLFKFDNVIITPHIGSNTNVGYRDIIIGAANNIVDFFKGNLSKNILNSKV